MIVALCAFVLLGSIVDLLIFPKIVMRNIASMHRKHDVKAFVQNIIQNIVEQCFVTTSKHRIIKNIALLRKVNIAHPYALSTSSN